MDRKGDIIQIGPSHKWAFCLAVVDEPKAFGCQAYIRAPFDGDDCGDAFIRLNRDDYEPVAASVVWGRE